MVVIVDYGMGNLKSVYNALCALKADVKISSHPRDITSADRIIVPGVGSFGDAMAEIEKRMLIGPLQAAIQQRKPFLGICLGLQLLYEESAESPGVRGFGVFKGTIQRFQFPQERTRKIPHMGWNTMQIKKKDCPLIKGVPDNSYFYFVHSYYAALCVSEDVLGSTEYGHGFASMVWRDSVYAAQFHPEKSQQVGLTILENFLGL